VLRWVEHEPAELDAILSRPIDLDVVVFGRTPEGLASSPERLRRTESIVNDLFHRLTGCNWDLMISVRLMRREAANCVVHRSTEPTLASDIEWPMMLRRLGFSSGYIAARGLTYETNTAYGEGTPDAGDEDLQAWRFRLELAANHLRVMRQELESG
jgi:hypothetical protein